MPRLTRQYSVCSCTAQTYKPRHTLLAVTSQRYLADVKQQQYVDKGARDRVVDLLK